MKGFRFLPYARSSRYWINLLITVLIALGIAISIEIIGFIYNKRLDLTSERRYQISDQFRKILNSLEGRIDVTVFYQSGERLELNDLLNQYALQSPKFHYELYDLDRNPANGQNVWYQELWGNRNSLSWKEDKGLLSCGR